MRKEYYGVVALHPTETGSKEQAAAATMASRVRPRSPPSQSQAQAKAYRVNYTMENKGRYFRSSKRRIHWHFGLTNLAAVRAGKLGKDCRGEEHEVELVWSIKSGKTRVYWNRRNISNLFREGTKPGMVEFAWKTRSGETVQIIAHSEATPGMTQYDLLIDGTSFFRLPDVSDLGSSMESGQTSEERRDCAPALGTQSDHLGSGAESLSELGSLDPLDARAHHAPEDLGYRLAMVGLNQGGHSTVEPVDELHSELFSPMLESLRHQITECLPQTEEMISRAIINAFYPDTASSHSEGMMSASSGSSEGRNPEQLEADALWEAREWTILNVEVAPRPDAEELALSYMQKQIDAVFLRVRNEELTPDEAARILLGVAAVLGLKFANSVPMDTMLFLCLDKSTSLEDLRGALESFGEVLKCGISTKGRDFGYCRILDESTVEDVQEAAEIGSLLVGGVRPRVLILSERLHECEKAGESSSRTLEDDVVQEIPPPPPPESSANNSFSAIPHLMGPLTSDSLESEIIGPAYVTPDHSSVLTRRAVLTKEQEDSSGIEVGLSYPRIGPLNSPDSVAHMAGHAEKVSGPYSSFY